MLGLVQVLVQVSLSSIACKAMLGGPCRGQAALCQAVGVHSSGGPYK